MRAIGSVCHTMQIVDALKMAVLLAIMLLIVYLLAGFLG
jgi:hypothetical protein